MANKFVSLSDSSLTKVWDWCEENKSDPLSESYMGACLACGHTDWSKIATRLKTSWPSTKRDKSGWFDISYNIGTEVYKLRDIIGRVILDVIKREKQQ